MSIVNRGRQGEGHLQYNGLQNVQMISALQV